MILEEGAMDGWFRFGDFLLLRLLVCLARTKGTENWWCWRVEWWWQMVCVGGRKRQELFVPVSFPSSSASSSGWLLALHICKSTKMQAHKNCGLSWPEVGKIEWATCTGWGKVGVMTGRSSCGALTGINRMGSRCSGRKATNSDKSSLSPVIVLMQEFVQELTGIIIIII